MLLPPQTPEILYNKVTNEYAGEAWVVWAIDMLEAGFDTEHLRILAGETGPYDSWRLKHLTDRVLQELGMDVTDTRAITVNYVCYILKQALAGNIILFNALKTLRDIHEELEDDSEASAFYFLFYAWDELLLFTQQFYWQGATRENIEQITLQHFQQWLAKHCGQ